MPRPVRDVTETELSILQALWDLGPATVRQLVERLYPDAGPSAPATVQKLLERLEGKDYVARDRGGPAHQFAATIDRGTLISTRLRGVAEELCDGSLTSLLTHLVQTEGLSQDDRSALPRWSRAGSRPRTSQVGTSRGGSEVTDREILEVGRAQLWARPRQVGAISPLIFVQRGAAGGDGLPDLSEQHDRGPGRRPCGDRGWGDRAQACPCAWALGAVLDQAGDAPALASSADAGGCAGTNAPGPRGCGCRPCRVNCSPPRSRVVGTRPGCRPRFWSSGLRAVEIVAGTDRERIDGRREPDSVVEPCACPFGLDRDRGSLVGLDRAARPRVQPAVALGLAGSGRRAGRGGALAPRLGLRERPRSGSFPRRSLPCSGRWAHGPGSWSPSRSGIAWVSTSAPPSWSTRWPTCGGATTGSGGWKSASLASTGGTPWSGGAAARFATPRSAAATPGSSVSSPNRPGRTRRPFSRPSTAWPPNRSWNRSGALG